MLELIEIIGLGLILLLPLTNPLTTVALFLGLAAGMDAKERRRQIDQTALFVFLIMTVAYYLGYAILQTFGISIPGLRIAGGLIVGLIGLQMLLEPQKSTGESEAQSKAMEIENRFTRHSTNIAFIPLAMPSTAGPGTIAMLISTADEIQRGVDVTPWVLVAAPIPVFLILSAIVWLCLRSSGQIMRLLGESGISAIARLMGFLLVCLGVQFTINGTLDIVRSSISQ